MNKVVILVEDDIFYLRRILCGIQTVLFVASIQELNNAPKDGDTEVYILHVLWDEQSEESRELEKKTFQQLQNDLRNHGENIRKEGKVVPLIDCRYGTLKLDKKTYMDERFKCKEDICNRIKELCNGRDYAIMLNLVLCKEEDINIVLGEHNDAPILSHMIYEEFGNNCIPYTNYSAGGEKIRQEWSNRVRPYKMPFERSDIIGNAVYVPFKKEIYKMLNIKEDKSERI